MIFKLQNLKCRTFLVWFKIIILRYLQKTLVYRSYQGTWKYLAMSYVGFLFLKNSFTPSWQVARIWAVKPYHSNGLMRLNQLLTLKLARCLLTIVPVLLGVVFFSVGVIKFNTLSKWYNSYFLGYDGNLIKVISRCFKVKCFSRQIFLRVVFPSYYEGPYFSRRWAFFPGCSMCCSVLELMARVVRQLRLSDFLVIN